MRAATLAHLIAAEDLADAAAGDGGRAASCATSTSTAATRSGCRTQGQVVVVDLDEGAGIGSWDLRAARHALTACCGAGPRRTTRRCAATSARSPRPRRSAAGGRERPATRAGVDPRPGPGQGAGPRRSPRLRRLRAPERPRPGAPGRCDGRRRGAPAAAASSATSSTARSASSASTPTPSASSRDGIGDDRRPADPAARGGRAADRRRPARSRRSSSA